MNDKRIKQRDNRDSQTHTEATWARVNVHFFCSEFFNVFLFCKKSTCHVCELFSPPQRLKHTHTCTHTNTHTHTHTRKHIHIHAHVHADNLPVLAKPQPALSTYVEACSCVNCVCVCVCMFTYIYTHIYLCAIMCAFLCACVHREHVFWSHTCHGNSQRAQYRPRYVCVGLRVVCV